MYYVSNQALIDAIRELHRSGVHEHFKNYLVLKAHGLEFGNFAYIAVTTTNTTPSLELLFQVEGLPDEYPFYNPLYNERLKKDAARGVIQTNVKKFLDLATKTKMTWLEGYQDSDKSWQIRFSSEYPLTLGKGESGLAIQDHIQISIPTPSFVLWLSRNKCWEEKVALIDMWQDVRKSLNLHDVEVDLLFTKERDFDADPFVDTQPDRQDLVSFILNEQEKGSKRGDVLQTPSRAAFSPEKIQRIVSSHKRLTTSVEWWQELHLLDEARQVVDETRALLLIGPPGTGKTRLAFELAKELVSDSRQIHFIQFHASVTYEDFIESLMPEPEAGVLRFKAVPRRFSLACQAAQERPQVVIIDELNRADVSKVFGEAFFLIEREYRDIQYSVPFMHDPSRKFWVPQDLYLIATMNDLDRSTHDLDFAFRRRFGQVNVRPSADHLQEIVEMEGCTDEDFVRILRSAFNEVQSDYPLGHAYFKGVKDRDTLRSAYRRVIRPTVISYLGQYRQEQIEKVDNIFYRVIQVSSWDEYIEAE